MILGLLPLGFREGTAVDCLGPLVPSASQAEINMLRITQNNGLSAVSVLVCALSLLAGPAGAGNTADSKVDPIFDMSLNDLLQLEVSSVSRRLQQLREAAAAVHVITAEDIRRSGVTSIPEALRMVPGISVGRINASNWAVTSRGFNGGFSNKLLVLMDGRTLYTPAFSGVYWDVQDTVLDNIERIEVIRGPGATLWGGKCGQRHHQYHHQIRSRHTGRAACRAWR